MQVASATTHAMRRAWRIDLLPESIRLQRSGKEYGSRPDRPRAPRLSSRVRSRLATPLRDPHRTHLNRKGRPGTGRQSDPRGALPAEPKLQSGNLQIEI